MDIKELREHAKNLKVLYVEDNKDARESTLMLLDNFFDNIIVAVDGQDGLDKYTQYFEENNSYVSSFTTLYHFKSNILKHLW